MPATLDEVEVADKPAVNNCQRPGVTLITPTGGRPKAFALCRQFVERQTWAGPLQWIVVDDCEGCSMPLGVTVQRSWTVIHPRPPWQSGQNTLARNLLAAIPEVRHEYVLVFEDDDHYQPGYIEAMVELLERCAIAGTAESRYYNLRARKHRTFTHLGRSSLCHTGFRAELLPVLEGICRAGAQYIDVELWASVEPANRGFLRVPPLCTGMKGLPGRPGIGIGHTLESGWDADPELRQLREWIGEDVELYQEFI